MLSRYLLGSTKNGNTGKLIRIVGLRDLTYARELPKRNKDTTNITLN
jgi:hypothetical protein